MSWRISAGDAWQAPCRVAGGRIAGRRIIARPPTHHAIPRDGMPSPRLPEMAGAASWLARPALPRPVPVSLGAASAGHSWRWAAGEGAAVSPPLAVAEPSAAPLPTTTLRMSALLMRMMNDAARASGRDAAEVWAEAAREWLRQRDRHDDEPQPPAPVAAALAVPRRDQVWCGIDAVLADLRSPRSPAAPAHTLSSDAAAPASPALAAA